MLDHQQPIGDFIFKGLQLKGLRVSCSTYKLKYNPEIFDDQYIGCADILSEDTMPRLLRHEKNKNQQFNEAWKMATKIWHNIVSRLDLPDTFEDEHGIALLVFTNNLPEGNPIHTQLNGNLTIAGASRKDYMEKFHFKALHFYLTRALQILKPNCESNYTTFRGSFDSFKVPPIFKFGRFTSTSLNKTSAQLFGTETFFEITTCFGAGIGDFSIFPWEDEVLIPPTEKFVYMTKDTSGHILKTTGKMCSFFNCAIMGVEKKPEATCISDIITATVNNVKYCQVRMPSIEYEERITVLEDLLAKNHDKWDNYQTVIIWTIKQLRSIAENVTLLNNTLNSLRQEEMDARKELQDKVWNMNNVLLMVLAIGICIIAKNLNIFL
ncbi:ecto-ADP-ribosyltransferase 5-like [Hyperolius riggenbachi]|uniref:ecto-ADP-ribosyltransferase 5-like n=1 Tax=Hyperolius riggenbachi TaxID=752182 RepID=UPI0035A2CFD2